MSAAEKLSTGPSRARARGLDVDGNNIIQVTLRPRAREELLCTWHDACLAADYVLEKFGNRHKDRGIWVWYCRRLGLDRFLDIADEIASCVRQGELRFPVRAFQRRLQEAYPKAKAPRRGGAECR